MVALGFVAKGRLGSLVDFLGHCSGCDATEFRALRHESSSDLPLVHLVGLQIEVRPQPSKAWRCPRSEGPFQMRPEPASDAFARDVSCLSLDLSCMRGLGRHMTASRACGRAVAELKTGQLHRRLAIIVSTRAQHAGRADGFITSRTFVFYQQIALKGARHRDRPWSFCSQRVAGGWKGRYDVGARGNGLA